LYNLWRADLFMKERTLKAVKGTLQKGKWAKPRKTKVTSSRRGEDWGEGEKEGRVGDFRELDRSTNKHEFSLRWVKREVRRHPVGNVREQITEIVGCIFEGIRRRERYVKLSVISIEVVGEKGQKGDFWHLRGGHGPLGPP
jgi:hypothetical protein